jgi:hypothetical protein
MKRLVIPAALAAVLIGPASAQSTTPGSLPTVNTNLPAVNPALTSPFGTTPGFTDPRFGVNTTLPSPFGTATPGFNNFDPRLRDATGAGLGFTPGVTPGNNFVDFGLGGGFFVPGWGYTGPIVDPRPAWMVGPQGWNARMGGGAMPIVGLNTPPLQAGPRRAAIRMGSSATSRVAGSRQELRGSATVSAADVSPTQVRLAKRMEDAMEDRPMIEATVLAVTPGEITVRFESGMELRTRRLAPSEVFFFEGSKLASGSTDRSRLSVGESVLIAEPVVIRQSVAGSRQETRSGGTYRRPAK